MYETHERALTRRRSTPTPALRLQRAELTNALDKLRATRQALEKEKSVTAALTAKLAAAANAYRAVGQTFNAVRRGVDEVSGALSRVEARQGRGHGGGDTCPRDGDADSAVAALARLVAECVHRDAFARRRAEALLVRERRHQIGDAKLEIVARLLPILRRRRHAQRQEQSHACQLR